MWSWIYAYNSDLRFWPFCLCSKSQADNWYGSILILLNLIRNHQGGAMCCHRWYALSCLLLPLFTFAFISLFFSLNIVLWALIQVDGCRWWRRKSWSQMLMRILIIYLGYNLAFVDQIIKFFKKELKIFSP